MTREYTTRGTLLSDELRKAIGIFFCDKRQMMARTHKNKAYLYTQEMVGLHIGVKQNSIHCIETGKTEPTLRTCYALRKLYGITEKQWIKIENRIKKEAEAVVG